jgi:hypothetical protein
VVGLVAFAQLRRHFVFVATPNHEPIVGIDRPIQTAFQAGLGMAVERERSDEHTLAGLLFLFPFPFLPEDLGEQRLHMVDLRRRKPPSSSSHFSLPEMTPTPSRPNRVRPILETSAGFGKPFWKLRPNLTDQ